MQPSVNHIMSVFHLGDKKSIPNILMEGHRQGRHCLHTWSGGGEREGGRKKEREGEGIRH